MSVERTVPRQCKLECHGSVPVAVVSVERTVPRQCKLECRGLVRVAVVSVERTVPRQRFLTTSVAEN